MSVIIKGIKIKVEKTFSSFKLDYKKENILTIQASLNKKVGKELKKINKQLYFLSDQHEDDEFNLYFCYDHFVFGKNKLNVEKLKKDISIDL